jgi:hypothetical protein
MPASYAVTGGNTRLGRNWGNALIRGVRLLSNVDKIISREVDENAEFIPGMIGMLDTDANGKVVVKAHNGSATTEAVGMFINAKTQSFYKATAESVVAPNPPGTITLKNANVADVLVVNATTNTPYSPGDYTVNTTNGIISTTTNIPNATPLTIFYRYKDLSTVGFDNSMGSGMTALLEEDCEVALLVYDTSKQYVLNGNVKVNSDGFVSDSSATGPTIGYVTKVPTLQDPTLHVKLKWTVA